jgi:hypothetical protein
VVIRIAGTALTSPNFIGALANSLHGRPSVGYCLTSWPDAAG